MKNKWGNWFSFSMFSSFLFTYDIPNDNYRNMCILCDNSSPLFDFKGRCPTLGAVSSFELIYVDVDLFLLKRYYLLQFAMKYKLYI